MLAVECLRDVSRKIGLFRSGHGGLDAGPGLTCQAVPLVDGEQAVGGDGDDGGHRQARLSVGSNVGHRRVGRELEHHDDVLLHLLCEHQRGLQEKILFRVPAGRDRGDDWAGRTSRAATVQEKDGKKKEEKKKKEEEQLVFVGTEERKRRRLEG